MSKRLLIIKSNLILSRVVRDVKERLISTFKTYESAESERYGDNRYAQRTLTGVVQRARHVAALLFGIYNGLVSLSAGHNGEFGHVLQELVIEEQEGRANYR